MNKIVVALLIALVLFFLLSDRSQSGMECNKGWVWNDKNHRFDWNCT